MKKNILVFNERFFQLSETFIYHYIAGAVDEFNVHLLSYKRENRDVFSLPDTVIDHQLRKSRNIYDDIRTFIGRNLKHDNSKFSTFYQDYIRSIIRDIPIDMIHAHYGTNALTILPFAREREVPLVVTFHGFDASRSTLNQDYMRNLQKLFDYASAIIIVSPHMVDSLKLHPFLDKVHLVPYGINADFFKPNSYREEETFDILHSGRLVEKKGVPDLIKIFHYLEKKYENVRLHIAGDGPQLPECKKIVSELNIPAHKVTFHGAQSHTSVKYLMDSADIFVLNSRTDKSGNMEGLPNSILEAMSMEKPIVSTFHAGIPSAITNGYNGLLVPENDNDALEKAIEKLYQDKPLRKRLGRTARKTVLDNFTVQLMQSKINAIYKSIL